MNSRSRERTIPTPRRGKTETQAKENVQNSRTKPIKAKATGFETRGMTFTDVKREAEKMFEERAQLQDQIGTLKEKHHDTVSQYQERNATLQAELDQAKITITQSAQQITGQNAQIEELQVQVEELSKDANLRAEYDKQHQQLLEANRRNNDLEATIRSLNQRITAQSQALESHGINSVNLAVLNPSIEVKTAQQAKVEELKKRAIQLKEAAQRTRADLENEIEATKALNSEITGEEESPEL